MNFDFRLLNQYAMQHGVVLGLFGLASLVVFRWSFTDPFSSMLFVVMLLMLPILTAHLTLKYRRAVAGSSAPFGFMQGFLQALFIGIYASVWVALGIFIYLQFLDNGTIFQIYADSLKQACAAGGAASPVAIYIDQLTGGEGPNKLVKQMMAISPANYAFLSVHMAMLFSPISAAFIALFCRRG